MTTTISSSSYAAQRPSPRDMLQNTLAAQVSSGEVSSSDASALSSALDQIDQAMKAERGSFSSTRTAPPSPDEAKSKIDSLIAEQVEAGTLTEDQAAELKEIFSETFANGPGGGRGPGGPPPGPPPGEESESSGTTSLTITTNDSAVSTALQDFLKQLQEKLGSGYGTSGQSTSGTSTSLLFDVSA
ncbi:hypothetical protein C6569_06905 [Phreatobacter cathodiphilus]|uniref:Uncharacterized protein n=2 Tax=Phreatobacter cathodiphilus TaxID=1868589 RepID=A0A2S0N9F9_9HYPH|nr:hypothetical protein C6569_06905 [Phreatobacter cathodiphilus]